MKRILYGLLAVVVVLVGVTFSYKNAQLVELHYYFGIHWKTPLAFMLLTAVTLGIVIGILASLGMVARMQRQITGMRRDNRQLEQELHNLRALPIRDTP